MTEEEKNNNAAQPEDSAPDENTQGPQTSPAGENAEDTQSENPQTEQQPEDAEQAPKDSRNMAMLCHLLGLFTTVIAPLIIWTNRKDGDRFVDKHGREALNFQITVLISMAVGWGLSWVCIGFVILIAVPVLDLIFCIIASVRAGNGQDYRYPLSMRLIQ